MVNEKRKPNKNISTQIQLAPRYLLDKFWCPPTPINP
jgi:hypothetical protein